jgi:novobiocin biosynthesis protein NovU/D-mycarose 3-C-methyltransferase
MAALHETFRRDVCRYCQSPLPAPFLELGTTPLANAFTDGSLPIEAEFTCPLSVAYCGVCHLVQLTHVVPPALMFSHYLYVSSTNATFRRHFQDYAETIRGWFQGRNIGLAVDIGSNDGALVRSLNECGVPALGVEPAGNLSEAANRDGLPTINRYFDCDTVAAILHGCGPAGVITANNVFAHVDDAATFCRDVHGLLRDEGLFVIEVPYVMTLCERLLFDTIYHEHLSYLSVGALDYILRRHGFEVVDIEEVASHGGSLRVFSQKAGGPWPRTGRCEEYLADEERRGYRSPAAYRQFADRVREARTRLQRFVQGERARGARLAGYGAAAKASTLISCCGWTADDLAYVVDDNRLKQGRFAPGSRIPIVSADRLREQPPNAIVVFAWNFASEIVNAMRPRLPSTVRWIAPLPTPRYL